MDRSESEPAIIDKISNINVIQPCTLIHLDEFTHMREYGFVVKAFASGLLHIVKIKDATVEQLEEAISWLLDNFNLYKNIALVMLLREKQFKTEMEG